MPTLKELRAKAKDLGLKGYSKITKLLLVEAIDLKQNKPPPPPPKSPIPEEGMTRLLSVDIGKKNFAFCIEEFDKEALSSLKNLPTAGRYNADGTPTAVLYLPAVRK